MFTLTHNRFGGLIIHIDASLSDENLFVEQLQTVITLARDESKQLIWMTLPLSHAHYVHRATSLGFVFHNCLEQELTLIYRVQEAAYAPFAPTYSIGAGAIVFNPQGQVLVVKEAGREDFKFPGGHVELGEKIVDAVCREVKEETGVTAQFEHILGFGTKHPYQFGKSNMYIVCKMMALDEQIHIFDTQEISDAKWVSVDEYIADPNTLNFNRTIIKACQEGRGLPSINITGRTDPTASYEAFF